MRGFMVGSLGLIVLHVLVQRGTADKIAGANSALVRGFRRMLAPDVAGLPFREGE